VRLVALVDLDDAVLAQQGPRRFGDLPGDLGRAPPVDDGAEIERARFSLLRIRIPDVHTSMTLALGIRQIGVEHAQQVFTGRLPFIAWRMRGEERTNSHSLKA
jgi:hypothetical protein